MRDATVRYIIRTLREKEAFSGTLERSLVKAEIYKEMADIFEMALKAEEEALQCLGDG